MCSSHSAQFKFPSCRRLKTTKMAHIGRGPTSRLSNGVQLLPTVPYQPRRIVR